MNDVEKYLMKYSRLKQEYEDYNNRLINLKAVPYPQDVRGTSYKDMKTTYIEKKDEVEKEMKEIESFIDTTWNGIERRIIWNRYIEGKTFKEIGDQVGYSTTAVFNKIVSCLSRMNMKK